MQNEVAPVLDGWLTYASSKKQILARYASKYSIFIDRNGDNSLREIENLQLQVGDQLIEIGPCMMVMDESCTDNDCRLVALDNIHDFDQLFFNSKVVTFDLSSVNLKLTLQYKDKIKTTFKEYVANLTYDLNVFHNLFDNLDKEGKTEPTVVWQVVQKKIINDLGAILSDYMETQYAELKKIVSEFTEKEHEHHGFYFRQQLWHILLHAPLMTRTNLKPRGYNGDSEMMRMIYNNDYEGDSTFGKILHKYSISHPAAQAVRNRRHVILGIINDFIKSWNGQPQDKLRLLSVACGPAIELGDIFQIRENCNRLHVSLLDQDQAALLEASTMIDKIETLMDTKISAEFIKESVRTMLSSQELIKRWGRFDFIYSMGLFDYLTAPVASAVIRKLFELLNPNGELIIGNMFQINHSQYFMEYWHDWKIILRSEQDLLHLCEKLTNYTARIVFDETKIQMLLVIKKG